jgi:hypothetical protein
MSASRKPLRVGLLLDHFTTPKWIARVIEEVAASDYAEVALVVRNEAVLYPRPKNTAEWLTRIRRSFLFQIYTRLDERRFRRAPDPFEPTDLTPLLLGVPVIRVQPRMTKFSDFFEDEVVDRILEHDLDVALRFGFRILKGRSLEIARHGVWSYHHGDNLVNRGGPAGFWEVMENEPVTGSILQILTEELDNGRAIYRSWAATDRYSVVRNRQNYYWKSAAFIGRKLRDLHDDGPSALRDPLGDAFVGYSNRLYRTPTNTDLARALPRLVKRYVTSKVREKATYEQWFLGYKFRRSTDVCHDVPDTTLYNFKRITPPPDRFWADPFPVHRDGRFFVFFEEYVYDLERGHISVFELDPKHGHGEASVALARDYHLSFPYFFEWNGELYMVPETGGANQVEAFRAVSFPNEWQLEAVLLENARVVDPVITQIGERWWMFASCQEPGATSWDELHLYHADSPLGPWRPHRRNPVKSDVRSARSAGRIFQHNGRFYRPAQDCSRRYGYAITINEIVRISETAYEEREVTKLRPDWARDVIGTHTINATDHLTVIDAVARRSRFGRRSPRPPRNRSVEG